ncbi:MAG: META domain-containing protein [Sphingomonas sp.]|nr:META domain-containing protein [Sphingomonas sp.]
MLAGLALAGCAPVGPGATPPNSSVEGSWRVLEVKRQAVPSSGEYRISFDDGRLAARFGCNSMGGRYRQAGRFLHASDVASTLMGCPEPAGTIERDGGAILGQAMSISWTSRDHLELSNRAGGIKLIRAR